jgi:mRNA interferase YafQ
VRLTVTSTSRFRKEFRLAGRRGKNLGLLESVVECLATGQPLPARLRDHPLKGTMEGFRECHLEPDWLLVYRYGKEGRTLGLARTGTHSDLFG